MDPRLRRRDPAARDPPARAQFGVELEKNEEMLRHSLKNMRRGQHQFNEESLVMNVFVFRP